VPPLVPSLDILRKRLRSKLGNPDVQVISDADLDGFLEEALNAINEKAPAVARTSFDTVANQSTYQVLPAAGLRFKQVYTRQSSLRGVSFGEDVIFTRLDLTGAGFTHGADVFENPATVEAFFKKNTAFNAEFGSRAYWWAPDDGQSLTLYPTPTGVCAIWFDYVLLRFATVEAVEKRYERALMRTWWGWRRWRTSGATS